MAMRTTDEVLGAYREGNEDGMRQATERAAKICEEMAVDVGLHPARYNVVRSVAVEAACRLLEQAAARIRGEG